MYPLTTLKFIIRRLTDDWKLLLSIFLGVTIASTLVAAAPVYLTSLHRLGVNTAIDRAPQATLDMLVFAPNILAGPESIARAEASFVDLIDEHASPFYESHERHLRGPTFLLGTPERPLIGSDNRVSQGYFQSLTNLEPHVEFLEGRMAGDEVVQRPGGPQVEVVISLAASDVFGLHPGDSVVVAPSFADPNLIVATVTGVVEAIDDEERYWQRNAGAFLDPAPLSNEPDVDVTVDPEEPPLGMFLTAGAMAESLSTAYPGTLVNSDWYLFVDKESLKRLDPGDLQSRIVGLENGVASRMPGAAVLTGMDRLLAENEQRSFFSMVPLLLLLAIMVMTVLYYLGMMVSYLVRSRQTDMVRLRSRGVGTAHVVRLFAVEGMVLTVVAVVMAPFLAMGVVALAGTLPYFQGITAGRMLPVELRWTPFIVSLVVGVVSLAIFVVPGVAGSRPGLIVHRLRSSRPPMVPVFQRYFLDLLLIVIGGIVFWELQTRGQLVSGGLFGDVEVNEALLFAPVLLLTAVALLFMRVFPMFVGYISGESPALVHVLAAATVVALAATLPAEALLADTGATWILPSMLALAIGGVYWVTSRTGNPRYRYAGLSLQAALVAVTLTVAPPTSGSLSFVPSLALIALVPAEVVFLLLRSWARSAPVWVSVGLWHMARNPLQYSWLVLLLVMATGLGVLATTVGGTLDRSHEERILYEVAADLRVTSVPGTAPGVDIASKQRILAIDGVDAVSLGLRGEGSLGTTPASHPFDVLAVEASQFQRVAWYREDFSQRPLDSVMNALRPRARPAPLIIPEGATEVGAWVRARDFYPNIFLWMIIEDSRGFLKTVSLGNVGDSQWHLMRAPVPPSMIPPLEVVSLQLFEPAFGPGGTPGVIWVDDIHAVTGPDDGLVVLDDFENGTNGWTPLATSMIASDALFTDRDDAFHDNASGLFSFGKDTDKGIRGLYRSPSGGPVRIAASTTFLQATGTRVGDDFIISMFDRLVPVSIQETVDYFPTMDPSGTGFVLADLESTLRHINILNPSSIISANELFVDQVPGAGDSVKEAMTRFVGSPDLVQDKESQLESVRLDPLIAAGWKAMVLVAAALIVFTTALGYATYLLAFADKSRNEMGFLRSLGLSRNQMAGLLTLEHLVIVLVGLGLGSVTGWLMSGILVSSVSITERGTPVVPPFILETDLLVLGSIFAAFAATFLASVFRLTRGMRNIDLHTVVRLEEE